MGGQPVMSVGRIVCVAVDGDFSVVARATFTSRSRSGWAPTYGPSDQVKTVSNPQERTVCSPSALAAAEAMLVVARDNGAMDQ